MRWVDWLAQVEKIVQAWRGQQAFGYDAPHARPEDAGWLCWTSWIDPGRATGFGAAVYLVPPSPVVVTGHGAFERDRASQLGSVIDTWTKILKNLGTLNVPADLLGTYDATGGIVLTYWAEDFYARGPEEEPAMVRRLMSRVRGLGAVWSGDDAWDVEELYSMGDVEPVAKVATGNSGLGRAGIGSESFTVLQLNSTEEYVSPLRIIAAYRYALEDEFGVRLLTTNPGDAKTEFGAAQFKRLGMWLPGLDHVRDAMSHVLFGIRKSFRN